VGIEVTTLGFLLCNEGRLAFTSLRTGGALACRVSLGGIVAEPLVGAVLSFGSRSMSALEFVLSALRRAGFFRGFLGVVLEGCSLEAASFDAAISIYLRGVRSLCQASVE
jgi:hypothetical protein